MSWNKYFIVVADVYETELASLIKKIGYGRLEGLEVTDFRNASGKRMDGIAFGLVNNSFWMISESQVCKFFSEKPSQLEINLKKVFPDSRILALEENANVGSFGFNYIEKGERIRVLSGCDNEYYYDYGEKLSVENENYESVLTEMSKGEKERMISIDGEIEFEKFIKFESLWRCPMSLLMKIMGNSIDDIYDENPSFLISF